ncbi:MAG TPA: hypothetical protein VLT59_13035, partial [Steroidobacteraceae bacterium]|nr:hypothetical protein [Steroidobacteraceae bacterium]
MTRRLREWDTLPLGEQFRRIALLAVMSTVTVASLTVLVWALALNRGAVLERVDRLEAQVAQTASAPGARSELLPRLIADPTVLAARLESADGSVVSEYVSERAGTHEWRAESGFFNGIGQALWLIPVESRRPVPVGRDGQGTLTVVVNHARLWQGVAAHLALVPVLLVLGWLLAGQVDRLLRRLARRVTDPLVSLAVATRGGQWQSSEQLSGAEAPEDPVSEIVDNFEAMRERLAEWERQTVQVRRHA